VYASLNLSLAVLEILVQLPATMRQNLPEMAAVRIEVPDDATRAEVTRNQLFARSAEVTAARCRELGDSWLAAGQDLVLVVPSVIVPQEHNVLINPAHSQSGQIKIASIEAFRFDPRLAKAR
jgi:RES domain-containing protein